MEALIFIVYYAGRRPVLANNNTNDGVMKVPALI